MHFSVLADSFMLAADCQIRRSLPDLTIRQEHIFSTITAKLPASGEL
jgi:hypothetical protein